MKALHDIKDELKTLKKMIGMDEIKSNIVEQLLYFLQKMHINDENNQNYKHTIIYGSPGISRFNIVSLSLANGYYNYNVGILILKNKYIIISDSSERMFLSFCFY